MRIASVCTLIIKMLHENQQTKKLLFQHFIPNYTVCANLGYGAFNVVVLFSGVKLKGKGNGLSDNS